MSFVADPTVTLKTLLSSNTPLAAVARKIKLVPARKNVIGVELPPWTIALLVKDEGLTALLCATEFSRTAREMTVGSGAALEESNVLMNTVVVAAPAA